MCTLHSVSIERQNAWKEDLAQGLPAELHHVIYRLLLMVWPEKLQVILLWEGLYSKCEMQKHWVTDKHLFDLLLCRVSLCLWSLGLHRKASASSSALGRHVSVTAESSVPLDSLMTWGCLPDKEQTLQGPIAIHCVQESTGHIQAYMNYLVWCNLSEFFFSALLTTLWFIYYRSAINPPSELQLGGGGVAAVSVGKVTQIKIQTCGLRSQPQ